MLINYLIRLGCKSIGVEIEEKLIERFKKKLSKESIDIQSKVEIIHKDLREVDLSKVTILVTYLLQESIIEIKPILIEALRRGTTLICNTWGIKDFKPIEKISCGTTNVNIFKYTKECINMKVNELRLCGNESFKEKNYESAIEFYTSAIELNNDDSDVNKAILYSNRSACNLSLKMYVLAADDAQKAISLDVKSVKSYFRLATALYALNKVAEAVKICDIGILIDPNSSALLQLRKKCSVSESKMHENDGIFCSKVDCIDHDPSLSQFCMSCTKVDVKAISIHEILASKVAFAHIKFSTIELQFLSSLRQLVTKIVNNDLMSAEYMNEFQINPTFLKLMDGKQFADMIFPGTPTKTLSTLPKSVRELLMWKDLVFDVHKVVRSAAAIFENVSSKGSQRGDAMDEGTSNMLIPLIMQESLARELINAVRDLGKVLSNVKAKASLTIASTTTEHDYLDSKVVHDLCDVGKSIGQHHNFLGTDLKNLLVEETLRYISNEKMTLTMDESSSIISHIAWIEPDTLDVYYPVLAEVVNQLHTLPYEINSKSNCSLSLMQPTKGCTMLTYFPIGGSQPIRIDNKRDNEILDSGLTVSCAYHFFEDEEDEKVASLRYRHVDSRDFNDIKIRNDLLTIHQSLRIYTEREPSEKAYFVINYFIHGVR